MADFPRPKMRAVLWLYELANWLLLPISLGYLFKRGLKDKLYRTHIAERFGFHKKTLKENNPPVWIHAVSLGELRSAVPLIKALLDKNLTIVTTHYTPAGRTEAIKTFSYEIEQGRVQVVYVPFEIGFAFRNFYRTFRPVYGLVMEVEFWPRMITSARKHNVPLFLCNGQYPSKSYERDLKQLGGLRSQLVAGFAGVMVKSDLQAQRFASLDVVNIAITGELRFDQPIPQAHVNAGTTLRNKLLDTRQRRIYTIASAIKGEDHIYIEVIKNTLANHKARNQPPPLFVYVPRAPERFDEVGQLILDAGISVAKRSEHLDSELLTIKDIQADVILGDSMGEMYFYLALADCAIVGGGFVAEKGAHNISEALALSKSVIVGPHIWTIEYPAFEAIEAGVLKHLNSPDDLASLLVGDASDFASSNQISSFFATQSGAIEKTLHAIDLFLEERPKNQKT